MKYGPELVCTFSRRYDLSYAFSSVHHLSSMIGNSIFEFGETVYITAVALINSGFMPTPTHRVMLALDQFTGIHSDKLCRMMVPKDSSILPGETVLANEGFLSFSCPYPERLDDNVRDFEPRREAGWITYSAHQLGPENEAS